MVDGLCSSIPNPNIPNTMAIHKSFINLYSHVLITPPGLASNVTDLTVAHLEVLHRCTPLATSLSFWDPATSWAWFKSGKILIQSASKKFVAPENLFNLDVCIYIYITCVWFLSPAFTHVPARPGLKADQCGCQQFHIRPDRIWEDNRCWDRLVRFLIPPPSRNLGTLPRLKGSRYRVRPSQTQKKKTWLFSSHSSEAQLTILVETTDSLPTSTSGQKSAPGQRHTSSPQELLGHLRLTFLISCENMFYPNFTRPSTTGVLHTTGLFKVATSFSGCVYKMTA